jgi:1-acyl-sn-glycerol-3-phosphate acyltransferase
MIRLIFINSNSKKLEKPKFSFLAIANHKSNVDGLALYCSYYRTKPVINMTFLAKQEVKKSKIIDSLLSMIDSVFVDRESARSGMNAIRAIKELLLNNRAVCVFSEGTRIKNPDSFGEFKPGSISAAVDSQKNILPVAIINSHKV